VLCEVPDYLQSVSPDSLKPTSINHFPVSFVCCGSHNPVKLLRTGQSRPAQQGEAYDQRALDKLAPPGTEVQRFKAEDKVPAFLATL